ncbi:response regulator [Spirosoma validum]|uniref:Response regulator n=1 Tax=Spirosoma validum TaxID=2771355 RepID=A0A927GDT4_9BACT|nr:response regulator [Spirosoma validum]MBD2753998.1 response regulator [Spirosoma validum]
MESVNTTDKTFPILLIDDDPNLGDILSRVSQNAFPEADFIHFCSIEEAMDYLKSSPVNLPKLILLDINFNREEDGLAYLVMLRKYLQTVQIPIIILSMMADEERIQQAYSTGAVSFLEKSSTVQGWTNLLKSLKKYWSDIVDLPTDRLDGDSTGSLYKALE